MVAANQAMYEPPNQTSSVLLFWRSPEEWAQVLYDWVRLSLLVVASGHKVLTDDSRSRRRTRLGI